MTHPLDNKLSSSITEFPDPGRKQKVQAVREEATARSVAGPQDNHVPNQDQKPPHLFNFTKGLSHELNGLLTDTGDYDQFVLGTERHDPTEFSKVTPFKGTFQNLDQGLVSENDRYRQWESPTAGHAYVLQGPDPMAITMPPAPEVGSAEFAAEMAEVYQMALSRDVQIASFMDHSLVSSITKPDSTPVSNATLDRLKAGNRHANEASSRLGGMRWFKGETGTKDTAVVQEQRRRRFNQANEPTKGLSASTIFRGLGEDAWHTPFLSQLLVMGTDDPKDGKTRAESRAKGEIVYGAQRINQSVRVAIPKKDYMTQWADWLDVQNGFGARTLVNDVRSEEFLTGEYRFMARLRDMATYVHDDQLYQAYLNAALLLASEKFAFDPGIPYHGASASDLSRDNREPFALFGGPHLLTLVTEVSSRALKAVRLQKFSIHRRLRPEAAGALFHTIYTGYQPNREMVGSKPYAESGKSPDAEARRQLGSTLARYTFDGVGMASDPVLEEVLEDVRLHNADQNGEDPTDSKIAKWLLPMAFPEGSPMHPAYGAGHATVAGACVTLLKAFFAMSKKDSMTDVEKPIYLVEPSEVALVPDGGTSETDTTTSILGVKMAKGLTLEGELNKLMWNISNARNIAGVHYYTDYIESALLGEAITLGILREQMLTYHPKEKVTMTVPLLVKRTLPASLLEGSAINADQEVSAVKILSDGTLQEAPATPGRDTF